MTVTTPHLTDELLHRHFDGDLDRPQAQVVQSHLASCAQCEGKQRSLARLHDLVAGDNAHAVGRVDLDELFARVERGIDAQAQADKVVPLAARRARRAWLSAAGGVAVAAVVLLMVFRPQQGGAPGIAETGLPESGATTPTEPRTQAAAPVERSEVVEVDFGSNAGTVFDIVLEGGASTPVVWINDDE